jgi:hypothetical protein
VQRNSIAIASVRSQTAGVPFRGSRTRRFSMIKSQLCRRRSVASAAAPGHAGAGGARRFAMSDRISWNICRRTATSAI